MTDDFTLGTELPPLDLGETLGPTFTPPSAPTPRSRAKEFAPLLALLPIVMARGGQAGVAAMLQGYQQARQQNTETQRRDAMEARRDEQVQSQDNYRRQQLEQQRVNNEAMRRQQMLQTIQAGLGNLETPEATRAYMALMGPQASAVGIRPEALDAFVMEQMTPTRLQKKEAERILTDATKQYKDTAPQHTYTLSDGTQADWAELNRRAGVSLGAQAPTGTFDANTPDKLKIAALARELGKRPEDLTVDEINKATRTPPDPTLEAIRQLTLSNARAAKDTGSLPPRIQRNVDAQAKGFDAQPVTKRVQTMAEAVSFANGLDPNTKNPADDQALIYAFAKAMDPDSVVREGEYATVQKYAQSWAEKFGFDVARIFTNTAFLTPDARANMKATIQSRYAPARAQYDNVRRQYAERINRLTGSADGDSYLIDYGAAFPGVAAPTTPRGPAPPNPFRRGNASQ